MLTKEISVKTNTRTDFIDITNHVRAAIDESGVKDGYCVVFTPHTTAALTVNENADPAVISDISMMLDKIIPWKDENYSHFEENSAAHIKSSILGCSKSFIIQNGALLLGKWQNIYLCEFDGPRTRTVNIHIS